MSNSLPLGLKQALTEKLVDSLSGYKSDSTLRNIFGPLDIPGKVTAVIGMRRAGKTTFLHQLRQKKIERGVPGEAIPYVNFEDERLTDLKANQLGFLIEEHRRRFPDLYSSETVTWSFDEIQVVPGWERFVRRLKDSSRCEVLVTGSSAALLSREVATALRGRAWEVPIYPFRFSEALRFQGKEIPPDPGFLTSAQRAWIEHDFMKWLVTGGFPEAQSLDIASRHQLLRDYVDVAMLRDVVERHEVRNVTGLRWLVRHLLGNAAAPFSVEKCYASFKSQGIAISKNTVHQLLTHLEDCFLVRIVWMEAASERQRMINPRKVYPVDQGFIPLFDRSGKGNTGHALETAVLIELERRRFDVTYIRTPSGYEVDFLARDPEGNKVLIQVCADASDPDTADRELRALHEAGKQHPSAKKRLLILTRDGAPAVTATDVIVQTAYEWMLNPVDF